MTKRTLNKDTSKVFDISNLPEFPQCIIMQSGASYITAEPMGFCIENNMIFRNWILLMRSTEREPATTILSSFAIPAAKSDSNEDLFEEHSYLIRASMDALQKITDDIKEKNNIKYKRHESNNKKGSLH